MISINAVSTSHSINTSVGSESGPSTDGNLHSSTPVAGTATGVLSAINSVVPPGGLHPIANQPGTELFGFITKALQAAIEKSKPEPPQPTSGREMERWMGRRADRMRAELAGNHLPDWY
jgi:hypothetical protein